ncbi:Zn-ribbon domain-containing OB-fold protein [Natronococcus sp. A-GB1]|uniref:Zn-ribbon domain-containing OB-fold protein n=1 Tax=Natronococcus sp. A-GB1 TaxID=3037648 RepID=UPI00241CD206|nr:Zn-ribbon domain-containing OB-fold protein [Natronococcus sp. A-GB1]MDG5758569.1 Zn-ribbon domain-containing OB-fold protein [Natronococcus sp. A-GB1]
MTDGDLDAADPRTLPGFFDALADGELLGGVCADCGQVLLPPRPACYGCGSRAVDVEPRSREGQVFSYTEVHTPPPAFEADAPYTVAVVELADGGRLLGRVAADYADVAIGASVELTVHEPTAAEREVALDYETDWPVHIFEPR